MRISSTNATARSHTRQCRHYSRTAARLRPWQGNWKGKFMAVFSLKPSASCLKKAVIASAILLISAQAQAESGSEGPFVGLSGHWSAESERPLLTLVGTAIAKIQNVAVVFDPATKTLVRLHVGEAISGWFLRSVDLRTITLEKNRQTVTLALPAPGSGPAIPPAVSEASGASRRF
jgi:hypothetical protein